MRDRELIDTGAIVALLDRDDGWQPLSISRHYGIYDHPFEEPEAEGPAWDLTRRNVGALVTYSRRFSRLASARPHGELSSTRYCLADPGHDYLVFQSEPAKEFTVRLQSGNYRSEWFRPEKAEVVKGDAVQAGDESRTFKAPFEGPAVLYLATAQGRHP